MNETITFILNERQKAAIMDKFPSLLSLSKKSGITYQTIHSAYNGKRKASLETIYKIAKAIDMDFEVFRSL